MTEINLRIKLIASSIRWRVIFDKLHCVWHRWSSPCCTSLSSFDTKNDMICYLYHKVLCAMTVDPAKSQIEIFMVNWLIENDETVNWDRKRKKKMKKHENRPDVCYAWTWYSHVWLCGVWRSLVSVNVITCVSL